MLTRGDFSLSACGDNVFDVGPLTPNRQYFDARRVAGAQTDVASDDTWAFLAVHPPMSPKPVRLSPQQLQQLSDLKAQPGLPPLISRLRTEVATTEVEALPELFRRELPGLFDRYPLGSLWYVNVDPTLVSRLAFIRVLLQFEMTPDADFGGRDRGSYFNVHQLSSGAVFAGVIEPILLTFAPVVSGFAMDAHPSAFVFLFGQFDDDHDMRSRDTLSLAQEYFPSVNRHAYSPGIKVPVERLPFGHVEGLLAWWVTRLNVLYGHAADPTRFASTCGEHKIAEQAGWFLTFERLLADVTAMTTSVDSPGLLRMQGAFDALDKAAGLLARHSEAATFRRLLRRSQTLPRVHEAFGKLPLQMQSRFCGWATAAFDRLYDDIARQTMPSRITANGVMVGHQDADDLRELAWDDYVADLIREARNASHGLLKMLTEPPKKGWPLRRLMLATNAGEMPASLYEVVRVITFALFADAEAVCDRTW